MRRGRLGVKPSSSARSRTRTRKFSEISLLLDSAFEIVDFDTLNSFASERILTVCLGRGIDYLCLLLRSKAIHLFRTVFVGDSLGSRCVLRPQSYVASASVERTRANAQRYFDNNHSLSGVC